MPTNRKCLLLAGSGHWVGPCRTSGIVPTADIAGATPPLRVSEREAGDRSKRPGARASARVAGRRLTVLSADAGFGEGRHAGVNGDGGLDDRGRQRGARGFAETHAEVE